MLPTKLRKATAISYGTTIPANSLGLQQAAYGKIQADAYWNNTLSIWFPFTSTSSLPAGAASMDIMLYHYMDGDLFPNQSLTPLIFKLRTIDFTQAGSFDTMFSFGGCSPTLEGCTFYEYQILLQNNSGVAVPIKSVMLIQSNIPHGI